MEAVADDDGLCCENDAPVLMTLCCISGSALSIVARTIAHEEYGYYAKRRITVVCIAVIMVRLNLLSYSPDRTLHEKKFHKTLMKTSDIDIRRQCDHNRFVCSEDGP
jgi:hypothetical protein